MSLFIYYIDSAGFESAEKLATLLLALNVKIFNQYSIKTEILHKRLYK